MKLTRFRIQHYKCIVDSGWVEIPNLTVLVGKNEVGKTSLLKALHKLNPFTPEPYSIAREWPRGQRGERRESQVVCTAEFQLEAEEVRALEELAAQPVAADRVQVMKDYADRLEVRFPDGSFGDKSKGKGAEVEAETSRRKVHEYVVRHLPTFVYMDEYRTFCGTTHLDEVKQRVEKNRPSPEDETFLTLLALAGLDFEKEYAKSDGRDDQAREDRQHDLSDGEATLNQKIAEHWGQMRYQVEFRVDGYRFMTFVRGVNDRGLIRLEERSKGFQWFFSFDLMLMHETRGKLKGCVILLDEPGLHLHPEGQRDLLGRLAEYAKDNTVIYTTHLPFMIDLEEPDRIQVLSETPNGSVVSEDLTVSQPAARLVLQAALGIGGWTSWLVAEQNLVVEGAEDYWILSELSNLFRRSARDGLPPDLMMTPAGGAAEVAYLTTFMVGRELDVLALFDSDGAGRAAREKLVRRWLPKYRGQRATVLALADAVGRPGAECSIEDLFPEEFYVARVEKVYEKQLLAAGVTKLALPPGSHLARRTELAFQNANVAFNTRSVCKRIATDIRQMKTVGELPDATRRMVESLFAAVARVLGGR